MKLRHYCGILLLVIVFLTIFPFQCKGTTDPLDVIALQDMYKALDCPQTLKGWRKEGGDPCEESWTGITCSGSSVIHIKLHSLELGGYLGGLLFNLHSLKHLDVSSNNIQGEIPFGLPPNLTHLNLASNGFIQNIPHSLSSLKSLHHLNLSRNLLSGPVGNIFIGFEGLKEMDLSYNKFTGDLPSSFGSLTNLTRLFLQNNEFTGSVTYLAQLQLTDLNIQDNNFSGIIPEHFQLIPNLWIGGNKFNLDANYQPWKLPFENIPNQQNISSPPTAESNAIEKYPSHNAVVQENKKKRVSRRGIAVVLGGLALVAISATLLAAIRMKKVLAAKVQSAENGNSSMHSFPVSSNQEYSSGAADESPNVSAINTPPGMMSRPIPPVRHIAKDKFSRRSFSRKCNILPSAKVYTIAELQIATDSFREGNFLGEGSLGSVYKAEFPDGQIFAVKNIDTVSLSLHEEDQFLDVICSVSRLKHPNIVHLVGYCLEHGQHVLVYEYVRSLTLNEALHSRHFTALTWGLRIRIALGIARALDYMHSLSPPMAHCNLKAANILLDEELTPRLCDCGLAILRPLTSSSIKLKASEMAISNAGYIAPEHGQSGLDNTKTDVYAFGVLLLELLTGSLPFDSSRSFEQQSLVNWASTRLHDGEYLEEMVDSSIKRSIAPMTLSRYADIVSLCTQPEKEFRPPMSEIVVALVTLLSKSTTDGTDRDTFERSFRSTDTRFTTSPTMSNVSV